MLGGQTEASRALARSLLADAARGSVLI
jgi:hypothetical protein